jgi:hypothetical protein
MFDNDYWNMLILSAIEAKPYEEQLACAERCSEAIFKEWRERQKYYHKVEIKGAGSDYEL